MPTIIKTTDPLNIGGLFAVIYGPDGVGKTTLAQTAADCVVAMYDTGFKRSLGRKDAIAFNDWNDIEDYFDVHSNYRAQGRVSPLLEDFPNVKTVIHDTAGIMLDKFLTPHVCKIKGNRRAGGSPSLQGYGAMKHNFGVFLQALERDGLNHVFVCHLSIPDDGESEQKLRPRLAGGSYNLLMERADFCGFLEQSSRGRFISFDSDERKVGKNTGRLPLQNVPQYGTTEFSGLFQKFIDATKEQMEALAAPPAELVAFREKMEKADSIEELDSLCSAYEEEVKFCGAEMMARRFELWDLKARACASVEEFNDFIQQAKKNDPPKKRELFATLMECAKQAELGFDKKKGLFYDPTLTQEGESPTEPAKTPNKAKAVTEGTSKDAMIANSIRESLLEGIDSATIESLVPVANGIKDAELKAKTLDALQQALQKQK